MRSPAPLLALVVTLSACAPATAPATRSQAPFSRDPLTAEEIVRTPHRDVLSALRTLRPMFLNPRGARDGDVIATYIDGVRVGGIDMLATVPVDAVVEIRHMSGIDATTRFGVGHGSGVILVTTQRRTLRPR